MGKRFLCSGGGTLDFWEEGVRVFFRVELPADGEHLYKVWLEGEKGNELLLGTPTPERGALRLFRTISRTQLEYADCWPVQGVRTQQIPIPGSKNTGWYCETKPERLVALLEEREERTGTMLCRKNDKEIWLAAPFSTGKPVILSELFCLAGIEKINGTPHLIWCFDREGRPKAYRESN